MKLKQCAAVALVVGALATIGATPASAAEPKVAGEPVVHVWQDHDGWHVRVRNAAHHERGFGGVMHTSSEITNVEGVRLEPKDKVQTSADKHTLAFKFDNYGGVDGVDFTTSGPTNVQFVFVSEGHFVPVAKIAIGKTGRHPAHNPFVLKRAA